MSDQDNTILLKAIGEILKEQRKEIDAAINEKAGGARAVAIKEVALHRDALREYVDKRMHQRGKTTKGVAALNLPSWTKALHRG